LKRQRLTFLSGSCRTFGVRARPRAAIESDATTHRTPKALWCENLGARALAGITDPGYNRSLITFH